MQFCAPDVGRRKRLEHVERLTEISILRNVASCWLYSENILAMHGPVNDKNKLYVYHYWAFFFKLKASADYTERDGKKPNGNMCEM